MKSAALAALLLLAAPQEGLEKKVADLVARLGDDSIDARDQAVREIAELGPAAIPLLRKALVKLEGEGRGRVEEAIRAIELRDALARSLPPLKRITLDHKNRPAREAVEEIARQAGLRVHFEGDLGRGAVTLALKDATPLEALDAVCRKEGHLLYDVDGNEAFTAARARGQGPPPTPRLAFSEGAFVDCPAAYVRHYRLRVSSLSLTRTNTFKGTEATGSLQLDLHWPPDVRPDSARSFEVTVLTDDQGRSLLPDKKEDDTFRGGATHFSHGEPETSTQETVSFKFPEPGAKKIACLKGSFNLTYPKETRTLVFTKPGDMRGKSLDLHGLKVTLEEYKDRGTEHSVKIVVSGKYAGPKDPAREGDDEEGLRVPFTYDDVQLITAEGEVLESNSSSSGGSNEAYTFTMNYRSEKPQVVAEIRIPCVITHHLDKVDFEIRDVAFPP